MLRLLFSVMAVVLLAACGADHKFASDADVAAAHYTDPAPPSITLITSVNGRSNTGAHTALIINGAERVLFDPAGSWENPSAPERNDLHYGMTPTLLSFYIDYQGTEPFHVVEQTVIVSPDVAAQAIAAVTNYGSVPKAECTQAVSDILRGLPGFAAVPATWFPRVLSKGYGQLPGVIERNVQSTDGDLRRTLPGPVATPVAAAPVAPPA